MRRQFHTYRLGSGRLLLDLQSDFVDTGTRVTAPLVPLASLTGTFARLEPIFELDDERHALQLSDTAAIPLARLPRATTHDLRSFQDEIKTALDFLFWGF